MTSTAPIRRQLARPVDPLAAGSRPLVVLIDVDSLCSQLNGRVAGELIDTLRMLETSDAQIALVSTHAQELAAFMNTQFTRPWWCDRSIGWHDRGRKGRSDAPTPFSMVLADARERLPGAVVLVLSNDEELHDAIDIDDRVITFRADARDDALMTVDHVVKSIWTVIDIRTHHRRYKR